MRMRFNVSSRKNCTATSSPWAPLPHRLFTVEYQIDPTQAEEFARAASGLRSAPRRDGAVNWDLFQDLADPSHWVETFDLTRFPVMPSPPLVPRGFLKITRHTPDTTATAGIPGGDSVGSVAPTWENGAVLEGLFPTTFAQ
jgi:hypothetical protein